MIPPDFASLRPLYGSRVDALETAWLTASRDERAEIEIVLELLRRRAAGKERVPLLEPPAGNRADGPLRLGRIVHGDNELGWLGIAPNELMQHLGVFGRSGSGKSNLCLRLLLQLVERSIPWLIFDYKRSARHMQALELGRDVRVVSLGRDIGATMSFNILVPPPGVGIETHRRQLVELIAENWYAGDGVISLLERSMIEAFERCAPDYPTIADVRDVLDNLAAKSRELMWKTSAMRIVRQMTTGQLGRILCTRRDAAALDVLRRQHTVIELDGLATNDANFLTQHLMRFLTCMLLSEHTREQLSFICLVEEALHLLGKREGATSAETVLETCLREGREAGLGIILADQCISAVSPTALANCFTTVCLNARQRADVNAAAGSLLLADDHKRLLSTLPVGEAIVRLSDRFPHPVHIRIPRLYLPKGTVRDDDVCNAYLAGPYCAANLDAATQTDSTSSTVSTHSGPSHGNPSAITPRPLGDRDTAKTDSTHDNLGDTSLPRPPPPPAEATHSSALAGSTPSSHAMESDPVSENGDVQLFLQSVGADPLLGVAARMDAVGLSRRKGNAIKNLLVDEGYVTPVELVIPSGKLVLLQLTELGRHWLQRHHQPMAPLHGSLPHTWWQHRLVELLTQFGWEARMESRIGQHTFDVSAVRGEAKALIEVETGRANWLQNLSFLESARGVAHKAVVWLDAGSLLRAKRALPRCVCLLQPREVTHWLRNLDKPTTSSP